VAQIAGHAITAQLRQFDAQAVISAVPTKDGAVLLRINTGDNALTAHVALTAAGYGVEPGPPPGPCDGRGPRMIVTPSREAHRA
jgi:hypothetical protein